MDFPSGSVVKKSSNAEDAGSVPGVEKMPWRQKRQLTPELLPGKRSLGRGAWWATVYGVAKESHST